MAKSLPSPQTHRLPHLPKWLRCLWIILLHIFLLEVFLQLTLHCIRLHMPIGTAVFLLLSAGCIGAFLFFMYRICRRKQTVQKDRCKRLIILLEAVLFTLTALLPLTGSVLIYDSNFHERYETSILYYHSLDEFPDLTMERTDFISNHGQNLAGYLYSSGSDPKKGVVVMAHGLGGGGHVSYMGVADFFASNGYYVFAYDATANDSSEGDHVGGLPQGIIDLDHALHHVKNLQQTKGLPILLFGHSWGAYAICNVLNLHPDIRAVAAVSGFNTSIDMIDAQGRMIMGNAISLMLPYISLYETLKFNHYATFSAMDGFAASDAAVMIVHSTDDTIVPPQYGYDLYFDTYGDSDRFTFVRYETRGHNAIFLSDDAYAYQEQCSAAYDAYIETLEAAPTEEQWRTYVQTKIDKARYFALDMELFSAILSLYNESIQ